MRTQTYPVAILPEQVGDKHKRKHQGRKEKLFDQENGKQHNVVEQNAFKRKK